MAFALDVIVGSLTSVQSLSDGNPFSLEGATGLAMAPVRRLTEQAPRQDGDTDLGYRLDPRVITLSLNFTANSYSDLDTYRDLLVNIFRPIRGYSVLLRVTRDDGEVRQIECQTVGPVDVRLVREERAGKVHRAVVQLRAANPLWYDPEFATTDAANHYTWWTANNTINEAVVLEHVTDPGTAQAWTWGGTVADYTVAYQGAQCGFYERFAFHAGEGVRSSTSAEATADGGYVRLRANSLGTPLHPGMFDVPTTYTMHLLSAAYDSFLSLYRLDFFSGTTQIGTAIYGNSPLVGVGALWRGKTGGGTAYVWPFTVSKAVAYSGTLSATQRTALNTAFEATVDLSLVVSYAGDFPEYPTIVISGPINDFVITNETTGTSLDFTGATVTAGEVWTIGLAQGDRSIVSSTEGNRYSYLTNPTAMGNFAIVPSPVAAGGTNNITINVGSAGTAASVRLDYYNRYLSF